MNRSLPALKLFYAASRREEKPKMPNAFPPQLEKKDEAHALFVAAEDGDAAAVASLLATASGHADARLSKGGETPLMRAVARGHLDVARVLLDAGADASARRADGFTPLVLAVFFGHEQVARLLLERGADVSAQTNLGTTAARWATARGFEAMASMLREAEAARPREVATATRVSVTPGLVKTTMSQSDEVSIFSSSSSSANASVRSGGGVPAHPSAATFRLGHFLRSWQGSVGAALLLLAFAVSVFAFLRGGNTAREAARPAPQPSTLATQVVAQPPAESIPTPQPTPAFPTPDAQAVMPITDPAYALPNNVGQPFYVQPGAPVPGQPNTTRDLAVVSESGTPSPEESGRPKRKPDASANESAPAAAQGEGRDEPGSAADSRAARNTRPPDAEQQQQQRPAQPSTTPAPAAPAPQPTPTRAKVIQWPPQ
ncbi:MAG: hypothetical protein QOJ70_1634 [Acidobacteriota bacterium]|nr:hypothetical protein [Acidobacteriota bacterium]